VITRIFCEFSSDLAGFVDRPTSEMLECALLDSSVRVISISSTTSFKKRDKEPV
jgi:hypothetical protein